MNMRSTRTIICLIAAIITIVTFAIDVVSGWPFNHLLPLFTHKLTDVVSTQEFKVESLRIKSARVLNQGDNFSYKFQIPLDARGTTSLDQSTHIWVVLKDEHDGYYLQNPPVEIKGTGNWMSYNIRPLHGIRQILWLKVDDVGHSEFLRKRDNNEWGKFLELPTNTLEVAYAVLR